MITVGVVIVLVHIIAIAMIVREIIVFWFDAWTRSLSNCLVLIALNDMKKKHKSYTVCSDYPETVNKCF